MSNVHLVVPDGIDDPARPSGGNAYDRHLADGLGSAGWSVLEHPVSGFWRHPDEASFASLDDSVREISDGALVLVDGLIASTVPEVLVPLARRVRLVVLVHMPLGHRPADDGAGEIRMREQAVLSAASAVVTTSAWSRRRLVELYGLPPGRIHVAPPGVSAAELAPGTGTGQELLCVAALTPDKGHDVLVDGLATIADLAWRCVCVGSLDRDPECAEAVRRRAVERGLAGRVRFPGTATGAGLGRAYAAADVLVLASRAETYGMVVTEALARGLPVIATDVGGLSEALGHGMDGMRPGRLVPAGDPRALGDALRSWLVDDDLRTSLRQAARERRAALSGWPTTAAIVASVLSDLPQ